MNESSEELRDLRDRLLLAALPNVVFDGWTMACLQAAARAIGEDPSQAERLFPDGPVAAVLHFSDLANRRLLQDAAAADLASLRLTARVAWLVRQRLAPWSHDREAIRRAAAVLCLPQHVTAGLQTNWAIVDTIWRAAGDNPADFSYYTKRVTLFAVYSATLLFWLDDNSEDCAASWQFLDRRLGDVKRFGQAKAAWQGRGAAWSKPWADLMTMAKSGWPTARSR